MKLFRTTTVLAAAAAVAVTLSGCQSLAEVKSVRQDASPAVSATARETPTPSVTSGGAEMSWPEQVAPPTVKPTTVKTAAKVAAKPVVKKSVVKKPTRKAVRVAPAKKVTAAKAATKTARTTAKVATPKLAVPQKVTGPTNWAALNAAIARIPGYRPGVARWYVTSRYGHYGTTDLANGNIYISPNVPTNLLYSVAAHEYAHALVSKNYGGNWRAANTALSRVFGGSGMTAQERAADCMAKRLGASWTHYTSCTNGTWRTAAGKLLQGRRL